MPPRNYFYGEPFALRFGRFPHPIPFLNCLPAPAPVILFVPAEGIEQEATVGGPAIFEHFSFNQIVREGVRELRQQGIQSFWILSLRKAITLQGASDQRFVDHGLVSRCRLRSFEEIWADNGRDNRRGGEMLEFHLHFAR